MEYTEIDRWTVDIPAQRLAKQKFLEALKEILEENGYEVSETI